MRAMLLTAGLGTRLRPLTFERAKPSIPLVGKPIIVRLIDKLSSLGVSEFRMNLHYLPQSIKSIFAEQANGLVHKVSFSFEPFILGTAGGLKANQEFFQDETFLMVNGDIVFDFDLSDAFEFHRSQNALATLVLLPQNQPYKFYPVFADSEGRLVHFKEPLPHDVSNRQAYIFSGIHILEPEIFEYIPPGIFCEINDTVYPNLIKKGKRVLGFAVRGYWNDVGNAVRYLEAHRHILSTMQHSLNLKTRSDITLEAGASLGLDVWAEKGCIFKSGSRAQDCIFWENVTLEEGVNLKSCIIGSGVIVKKSYEMCVITREGSFPIE